MFPSSRTKYSVLIATFAIILMMGATFAASHPNIASSPSRAGGPSVTTVPHDIIGPVTGITQVGVDCGLGATQAVENTTFFPVAPTENGSPEILSSCTWIGDLALSTPAAPTDGTTEPLVTDQDESLSVTSPNIGGGFTADIVVLQNSTAAINGFDFQVQWNPTILRAVEIDQSGLPWTSVLLLTAKSTVDNTVGNAELAQVISGTMGGNIVLFRIRFDVIGVGNTGLNVIDEGGGLTNPGSVVHQTNNGAFNAESYYDPGATLHWYANFTLPSTVNPGGSNSFSAKIQGGTAPYTVTWQFDSCNQSAGVACTFAAEATGNPVTVTLPITCAVSPPTGCAFRVDAHVVDAASNAFDMVQHLPLTATEKDTTTSQVAGTAQTIQAFWIGGVPSYTGSQRFCPGTTANVICSTPTISFAATGTQTVTRSITYHFAGVYTDTLSVADSNTAIFGGQSKSSFTLPLNITGTPAEYTITIRPSTTSTLANSPVNFLAWANYSSTIPSSLRGTSITLTFNFGDSGSGTAKITLAPHGLNQTTISHTYIAASPLGGYTVLATGADSTISTVGETSNRVSITVIGKPSVTISCPSTGSAGAPVSCSATGSGGAPPYTFAWVSKGTPATGTGSTYAPTFSSSGPQSINVTLTDSLSQTTNATSIVTISGAVLGVTITGPSTGTVGTSLSFTANPTGGTSPYTFAWTATGGTPSSGTSATFMTTYSTKGTYTVAVVVTDSASHTATASVTVTISPLALAASISCPSSGTVGTAVACTASATGGTGPYSFAWTATGGSPATGTGTSFSTTYSVKGSESISVIATDSNAKTASASATVSISPLALAVTISCPSTGTAGSAVACTATPTGGTTPYTFAWTATGGIPASGTSSSFSTTFAAKGTYTISVTATDGNAKTATASATVTVAALPLTVNISGPATSTVGQSVTYTATVSGGTTPYSYAWTVNGVVNATAKSSTFSTTFNVKGSDTVLVTVTDANAKSAPSGTATTTVSPLALAASISCPSTGNTGSPVNCTASATGGTTPYSFAWTATGGSPASGTGSSFSTTYTATGPQTISVVATDANTKTASAQATVTISSTTITATIQCPATGTVGTAVACTASATGGTGTFTFAWTATGGSPATGTGTSFSTTYSIKGTFTISVTATDTASNTGSKSATVTISPLALAASISCPSTGTVGTAVACSASATGGTGPYTFAWTAAGGSPASGTGSTFSTIYPIKGSDTISLVATDSNAKTASASAIVTVSPLTLSATISCPATQTVGTAVGCSAAATGGTTPYTFAWTATGGSPASGTGATFSTTYSVKGTYTISVIATDSNAKTASASATVTISPLTLAVTISGPATGVTGTTVTFTANPTGGTAPYTYSWTATGGTPSSGTASTLSVTYSVKGSFTVGLTITDSNAKTATASVTIGISTSTPLSATISCPTTGTVGTAVACTASATGDTSPYTFAWTASGGSPATGTGASFSTTYNAKGTFQISVTATDANNVKATASASVAVSPLALVASITCPSTGSVTALVGCTASATGGTAPYSFAWTATGGSPASGIGSSFSTTYSTKGTYTISVAATDGNAKTASASASVAISPLALTASISCPTTGTVGVAVNCTVSAAGGTGPYTFAWTATGGSPASGTGSSFSTTYSTAATYTISVTATDTNSMTASASATVVVGSVTLTVAVSGPTSSTIGQSVTFTATPNGGTGPFTYAWSVNGISNATATSASFSTTFTVKGTMTVSVTVTDSTSKTASGSATITVNPLALAVVINCPTAATSGTTLSCSATASGGTAPYTFAWTATGGSPATGSGANFSTMYTAKGSHTIAVTATDGNGKTATASATVTISPLTLTVSINGPTTGTVGTGVTFTATATGGTTPYTFAWTAAGASPATGSSSSFTATYATKGTYTVTVIVTDANSATASASATITVAPVALSASFAFSPTSPTNGTQVTFTATVTGGTTPYSYTWSFGDSTGATGNPVNHSFAPGNFTVTLNVTDANGVSKVVTHIVTVTPTTSGKPFLLTFSAFSADDFNNGVGQLQVFVNGHLVVDIPAGLNHLNGTGDYLPYENTWVNFGPFDITAFIVHGQNNITFTDRNPADHFSRIKNVLIVQGTTVFLNVPRNVGIYPGFSKTYTFSNPPLVLTSFTATPSSPTTGQNVTFTANYTGGTAPFHCVFIFSDFHFAFVTGSATSCSTTRHFYSTGNFTAIVIVIGSSTSDIVTGRLLVTVGTGTSVIVQPSVCDAATTEIDH